MSGFRYRVRVFDPSDVVTPRVTLDEGTPALTGVNELDVTPAGDCGDASFTIVPTETDVRARDVVSIETTRAGGTAGALDWEGLYRGFVVQAPNSRETRPATVRLAGLRQRLFETTVTRHLVDGADVWGMADDLLAEMESAGTLPAGVTYAAPSPAPLLGFELGTRYPALESVGDLLDALVETVGEFVVPAGSTHEYRGVTYLPGDTVPACVWGVDSAGALFVERPQAPAVSASERSVTTEVQWADIDAESVVNRMWLSFAPAPSSGEFAFHTAHFPKDPPESALAIARRASWGEDISFLSLAEPYPQTPPADPADAVASPDDGPSVMAKVALNYWNSGGNPATNLGNAFDGDPSTFAEFGAGANAFYGDPGTPHGVWRWRVETLDLKVVIMVGWHSDQPPGSLDGATSYAAFNHYRVELEADGFWDVWLPNPYHVAPEVPGGVTWLYPVLRWDSDLRVYQGEYWVPDHYEGGGKALAYAQGLLRGVQDTAAVVTVAGLGRHSRYLNLTPVTGSDIRMPIERIAYSITSENGVKTAYHAGQAYDARLEAERTLLERLARRAVKAGGRRR